MARKRPQNPALLWGGLVAAAAGAVLALYAVTGDRAYHVGYLFLLLGALAVTVAGVATAAYGRVLPTTKAEPMVPRRSTTASAGKPGSRDRAPVGPPVRVRVLCTECDATFPAEGARPIPVTCPRCGAEGEVPVVAEEAAPTRPA